ncbi:MAG: AraC family transcriptional regulator [Nannocystaceae bacterium]|nr:AraC family transcriptional regulator [Nannocystaceae bacterium]
MKGAMVLSVSSRVLLDACGQLGIDTDAMLKAVGLEAAVLYDPDARISGEQVAALWREAHLRSGDPNLALHAVEALPAGAYKVIDFLASSSKTVGEGMSRISDYFPLINNAVELPIDVGTQHVTFGLTFPRIPAGVPRPYAEYTLAAVVLRSRRGFDMDIPLERVEFAYPKPGDTSEHERLFGCAVHFDTRHTRLQISHDVWRLPIARSDTGLCGVLEQHARDLLDALPKRDCVLGHVREAMQAELRGGDPSLANVAKTLGMSGRTLQRKLKEEDVAYAEVLDEVRAGVAQAYLSQSDIALAEVAYLLGFAEQSSFTRAFKRWTGSTPGASRAGVGA